MYNAKYYSGLKPAAIDAQIKIIDHQLCIQLSTDSIVWDLNSIQPDDKFDNKIIILKRKQSNSYEYIEINDPLLLEYIKEFYPQLIQKRSSAKTKIFLLSTAILLLAACYAGYRFIIPYMTEQIVRNIPKELESKLGNQSLESIPNFTTQLDSTKSKLLQQFHDDLNKKTNDSIKIYFLNDTIVNAFALPGGHIIIYAGILNKIKTSESLAGLIAHEYIHIKNRHGIRMMVKNSSFYMITSMLIGDITALSTLVLNNVQLLQNLSYSREFENEADTQAYQFLKSNELDPKGMIQLLEALNDYSDANYMIPAFLQTHPQTTDRINSIKAMLHNNRYIVNKNITLDSIFKEIKK